MPYQYFVLPMAVMVLLSFVVLISMFRARVAAVKRGDVTTGYFKNYQGQTEPEEARKRSRHYKNLFESPVAFYAVCLAALAT